MEVGVAYLLSKKINSRSIKIKTNNRVLDAKVVGDQSVRLNMGQPIFDWKESASK